MQKISGEFEENLFGASGLESSKKSLGQAVMDQLF